MKKEQKINIQSPLNYTGGKFKILNQIFDKIPKNINIFYDIFCGGFNVGINYEAKKIIAIDKNKELINLLNYLKNKNYLDLEEEIQIKIKYYKLSNTHKNSYEFYNCNSSEGLSKYNKENFKKLREDYNKTKDNLLFLLLIFYSFNNQIRFNRDKKFNLPVGKRDFNTKLQNKLKKFVDCLKKKDIEFCNISFDEINLEDIRVKEVFFYLDPPYFLGNASYNENKLWTEQEEIKLFDFLEKCNQKGIKFALSNVIEHKGEKHHLLKEWCKKNKFNINYINHNYYNSNYQVKNKNTITKEVLITNYVALD